MIHFTEAARQHLIEAITSAPHATGLRLSLKKSGCSGLSYVIEPVTAPQNNDVVVSIQEPYNLYVEAAHAPYLQNLRIDYVQQGFQKKLIFDNPNQTGLCGCGESFTVD